LKLQARKQADTALKPRLANDRGLHPETNNRTATGSALRSCMNANDRGLHPETNNRTATGSALRSCMNANDRGLHPETNNRTATGSALRSCMNANDRGLHPETKITVLNNPAHEETSTQAVKHRRP